MNRGALEVAGTEDAVLQNVLALGRGNHLALLVLALGVLALDVQASPLLLVSKVPQEAAQFAECWRHGHIDPASLAVLVFLAGRGQCVPSGVTQHHVSALFAVLAYPLVVHNLTLKALAQQRGKVLCVLPVVQPLEQLKVVGLLVKAQLLSHCNAVRQLAAIVQFDGRVALTDKLEHKRHLVVYGVLALELLDLLARLDVANEAAQAGACGRNTTLAPAGFGLGLVSAGCSGLSCECLIVNRHGLP